MGRRAHTWLLPGEFHLFFFLLVAACVKVPGGASFSQLHKGTGIITRTGQLMQLYKPKQIQTKQRQQQIPNSGGREDETDARAVRGRVQSSARGSIKAAEVHRDDEMRG